jgi:hypothetical protein
MTDIVAVPAPDDTGDSIDELPEITDNTALAEYLYVKDSAIHGKGLYALVDIEAGIYLGTYDGPEVKDNGMHVLWVEEDDGSYTARDGQNMLRYLNHSAAPLAEFAGFDLYTLQPIRRDTEITIDYGHDPGA